MLIFGLAWWAFVVLALIFTLSVVLTIFERPFFSLFVLVIGSIATLYVSGIPLENIGQFITDHLAIVASGLALYFILGIAYSFFIRWQIYTNSDRAKQRLEAAWNSFAEEWTTSPVVAGQRNSGMNRVRTEKPRTEENFEKFTKSADYPYGFKHDFPRIATWVLWWPIDALWLLCHDFLEWLFKAVGRNIATLFASSAKKSARKSLLGE